MPVFLVNLFLRAGIPERLQKYVLYAILALIVAFGVWLWFRAHDRAVIREHEREIVEEVRERTDRGNAAATEAAAETQDKIEQENDDARKAADGSDDPLKSALDRLRS